MGTTDQTRHERRELSELMLKRGPDAPTLCGDWTTTDLAAHLVVRESRPDAGLGLVFSPLAGWTDRVTRAVATQPYPELVRKVRTGPPTLSVFSLPGAEGMANLVEYFIHHEDVRRAREGWAPRDLPPELADELWSRLRQLSRLMYRRVPVGVTLMRTDGPGGTHVARSGTPTVTVRGSAQELLLRSYGRREVHVEVDGDPAAVEAFESATITM